MKILNLLLRFAAVFFGLVLGSTFAAMAFPEAAMIWFPAVPFLLGCLLIWKPTHLGRTMAIPCFVFFVWSALLALAVVARDRGANYSASLDWLFPITLIVGLALFIWLNRRAEPSS